MFLAGTYGGASTRLNGLTWGAEDLSVELGAEANRDAQGHFLAPYRLARALCLAGAAAAQVQAIDTVYVDFRNDAGLRRECEEARRDGFTGKMAIHPAQVADHQRGVHADRGGGRARRGRGRGVRGQSRRRHGRHRRRDVRPAASRARPAIAGAGRSAEGDIKPSAPRGAERRAQAVAASGCTPGAPASVAGCSDGACSPPPCESLSRRRCCETNAWAPVLLNISSVSIVLVRAPASARGRCIAARAGSCLISQIDLAQPHIHRHPAVMLRHRLRASIADRTATPARAEASERRSRRNFSRRKPPSSGCTPSMSMQPLNQVIRNSALLALAPRRDRAPQHRLDVLVV